MQLEQIVLGMRQRSGWEALDLGFALVRHAFRDIYAALFVVAVPLAALAVTLGQLTEPLYGWLLLWWAKPILDAVTLSVLARALIGERSKVSRVFTTVPRGIQRHLLGALTLRRLSPSRTFTMPVRHLEGLSSKDARRRIIPLGLRAVDEDEVRPPVPCVENFAGLLPARHERHQVGVALARLMIRVVRLCGSRRSG